MDKFPELPETNVLSWQQKNMKEDINLALDFIRQQVTTKAIADARMQTPLTKEDLQPYFEQNKYLTMEYTWNQDKYDVEEEKVPLFEGTGGIPSVGTGLGKISEFLSDKIPPPGKTIQKGFQNLFGPRK